MKTRIPFKRILLTLTLSLPLFFVISRVFSWHNRSIENVAINLFEIIILSVLSHIVLARIRRNFEIYLILSISMLFLSIPSFWLVGMSYGWGDQSALEYLVLWLFPIWIFPPSISELIDCIKIERQKS
jgi:hypothetical protein